MSGYSILSYTENGLDYQHIPERGFTNHKKGGSLHRGKQRKGLAPISSESSLKTEKLYERKIILLLTAPVPTVTCDGVLLYINSSPPEFTFPRINMFGRKQFVFLHKPTTSTGSLELLSLPTRTEIQ